MLRYFYLLCLVIYIKDSFCYDHISDRGSKFRTIGKRLKRKRDQDSENSNEKNDHVIKRRQEDESSNNDQYAQIDVASFIQKPDLYANEEMLSQQDDLNSQLMPKYNDYDVLSNLDIEHSNINEHNLKSNHNPALFKNTLYSNEHNLDPSLVDSKNHDYQYNDFKTVFVNETGANNLVQSPEKKSPMQHLNNLKLPFFFHRKNITTNVADINHTTKHKQQYTTDFSDLLGYSHDVTLSQKVISKRADRKNVCLKCKTSKGNLKSDKRGLGKSIIHNSRQYYQKIKGDTTNKKVMQPLTDSKTISNVNKETIKNQERVKPSVDSNKKEEKKAYITRHKKAKMHKHNEKATRKKSVRS